MVSGTDRVERSGFETRLGQRVVFLGSTGLSSDYFLLACRSLVLRGPPLHPSKYIRLSLNLKELFVLMWSMNAKGVVINAS